MPLIMWSSNSLMNTKRHCTYRTSTRIQTQIHKITMHHFNEQRHKIQLVSKRLGPKFVSAQHDSIQFCIELHVVIVRNVPGALENSWY